MINENKHIINRKMILVSKSINQRTLAKKLEITPAAVQQAISGGSTTYRLHRKIADYLRVPMVQFWPELYDNLNQVSHDATVIENVNSVN
jgi:lambda repressor-like predicted transcriptional regulator